MALLPDFTSVRRRFWVTFGALFEPFGYHRRTLGVILDFVLDLKSTREKKYSHLAYILAVQTAKFTTDVEKKVNREA